MNRSLSLNPSLSSLASAARPPRAAATAFSLRPYAARDRIAVARLLHQDLSGRHDRRGRPPVAAYAPEDLAGVPDLHERLSAEGGLVAVGNQESAPIGVCFVRRTGARADIGPLAVHPSHLGRGVAGALLARAVGEAEDAGIETVALFADADRPDLVALADRLGFSTRQVYFAFTLAVPPEGLATDMDASRVRLAVAQDIGPMAELENRITEIARIDEHALALTDETGGFRVHVADGKAGRVDGFAVATRHAAFNSIGPCIAGDEETAAALIACAAGLFHGETIQLLVPAAARGLIALLYAWNARLGNVRLLQARGPFRPRIGIVMPGMLLGGG